MSDTVRKPAYEKKNSAAHEEWVERKKARNAAKHKARETGGKEQHGKTKED
jgi:hypothetical protein